MARVRAMALPVTLRFLALAIAGITLVLIFIAIGFPYERLAEFIAAEVQRSSGVRVTFGDLGPSLQLMGPAIRGTDVSIQGSGSDYRFDRALLRPAWSPSWLRGRPAIHADLEGPLGSVEGTYTMGPELGWDGVLEGIDLEAPLIRQILPTVHLTGSGAVEMDVKRGLSGPEGWVRFELAEGSIAFGDFPFAIPFERIAGSMTLGDESFLTIEELNLEGPLMNADVTGSVESAPVFADALLNLQVQIQAQPDVQNSLASAGVRFDKDGSARVRISGTPLQPLIH